MRIGPAGRVKRCQRGSGNALHGRNNDDSPGVTDLRSKKKKLTLKIILGIRYLRNYYKRL